MQHTDITDIDHNKGRNVPVPRLALILYRHKIGGGLM